jgi:hypothetical protein
MQLLIAFGVAALYGALGLVAQEAIPERQMNVTQGPESVFGRPAAEILPALAGATATGENGRIGAELVFWGYQLANGRRVFFFACAPQPDVDCATRVPAICPVSTTVLETSEASGSMVRRSCRNIAVSGPGDLHPGCEDRVETTSMTVGLVSCG